MTADLVSPEFVAGFFFLPLPRWLRPTERSARLRANGFVKVFFDKAQPRNRFAQRQLQSSSGSSSGGSQLAQEPLRSESFRASGALCVMQKVLNAPLHPPHQKKKSKHSPAWKSLIALNCAFHINGVRGSVKQQQPPLI